MAFLVTLWEDDFFFGNPWGDALIRLLIIVLFMTVTVMMLIWLERKFVGRIQQRLGPTRTGPLGLLQSVADAGKLMSKEDLRPSTADSLVFQLAPFIFFVPIFLGFVVLPFTDAIGVRGVGSYAMPLGLFFLIATSSMSIVGLLMAGLASDNKYALMGALRSVAQMVSYEIPLVLSCLAVAMLAGSLDLHVITKAQENVPFIIYQPLGFFIFMTAATAEMARRPFDLPVAESELVGGPHVEYSGIRWSMFFLGEYANLFIVSVFGSALFLGGYAFPFGIELGWPMQLLNITIKTTIMMLVFMWIGATFPRLRIDQLMSFAWKVLIPLTFAQILVTGFVRVYGYPDIIAGIVSLAFLVLASVVVRRRVLRTGRRPRAERLAYLQRRAAARAAAGRVQ